MELVHPDEVEFESRDDYLLVTVPVYVRQELPKDYVLGLRNELEKELNQPVLVRMVQLTVLDSAP